MDVYFVRHGETAYNRSHMHQSPSVSLSNRGREQAITIAEELRPMNPTLLITSEYQRTRETASIMGRMLGLTPVVNNLFHEIRRPTELYGLSHYHPKTLRYVGLSIFNRNRPKWRMSDAENFADIQKRIDAALNFLESCEGEHQSVVVVSHTIFINLMLAYMHHERSISLSKLIPYLSRIMRMQNVAITHIKHSARIDESAWEEGA